MNYNTYHWYRKPVLHTAISLDNHDVSIKDYNYTYISEGNPYTYKGLIAYRSFNWIIISAQFYIDRSSLIFAGGRTFPGLGVQINLERHIMYHMTLTYIPSIIFVTVAWISFLVPSDVVPGRMVLCVTTLLTLTAMFNSVRYFDSRHNNW